MPVMAFADTATLHKRVDSGTRDGDGNKVYTWTDVESPGWVMWPQGAGLFSGGTSEDADNQDVVTTGVMALAPAGTDVTAFDAVTLRGVRYVVDGNPSDYTRSPLTGNSAGIQLYLRAVR